RVSSCVCCFPSTGLIPSTRPARCPISAGGTRPRMHEKEGSNSNIRKMNASRIRKESNPCSPARRLHKRPHEEASDWADRGLNHKENPAPHGARSGGLRLSFLLGVCVLTMFLMASAGASEGAGSGLRRQMELLGRGLVAVAVEDGVFLSWRLLGTEPMDLGFNVYR